VRSIRFDHIALAVALVYRWPRSFLRLTVEIDPDREEGPGRSLVRVDHNPRSASNVRYTLMTSLFASFGWAMFGSTGTKGAA